MATMSALIHHAFGHLWTGFYRVVEANKLLRIGPYQGTLGCLEIEFGRGVCGTAAAERRTVVVDDVHAFPGHISCDARSRSEIVVPILNRNGVLVAVLDIDADVRGAFDEDDQRGLERIVSWFADSVMLCTASSDHTPAASGCAYIFRPRFLSAVTCDAMKTRGYSDRINHAFAFAAKHHDRQVRKGTRLPYLTHPANVAVILTRYDQDDHTIVAGILHDVIEDCVRDGYTRQMLEQRIGDKFGPDVLDTVLAVTQRQVDEEGIELSSEERKDDYLARLAAASERARWVCAADKVHNGNTILATWIARSIQTRCGRAFMSGDSVPCVGIGASTID